MKEMTGLSNLKTEFKKNTKGSSIVEVLVAFTILLMCIGVLFSASRMTFNLLQKAKENNEITRAKNDILYMLKPVLVSGTITDPEAQKSFALSPGQYNTLYRDNYDTLENPAKAASGSTEKKEMVFALKDGADTIALTNTKELKYTITIDGNEYTVYAIDCDNISMPIKDDPFETNPGGKTGSGEGTGEGDVPGEEYVIISDDYLEIVKELFTIEKNDDGTYNYPEKGGIYYYDGDFYGIVEGIDFSLDERLKRSPDELASWYLITPLVLEGINPTRVSDIIRNNGGKRDDWGGMSNVIFRNGTIIHSKRLNSYYRSIGDVSRAYYWYEELINDLRDNNLSYVRLDSSYRPGWGVSVYEAPTWGNLEGKRFNVNDIIHSNTLNGYYQYVGISKPYNNFGDLEDDLTKGVAFQNLGSGYIPAPGESVYEVPEPIIISRGEIFIYDIEGKDEYFYRSDGGSGWFRSVDALKAEMDYDNTIEANKKTFKRLTKSISTSGSGTGTGTGGETGSGGGGSGGIVIEES